MLLEFYEPERKGSQIVIPDTVKDRTVMLDNRARVIAVGPEAWKDEGSWSKGIFGLFRRWQYQPRALPGDVIMVNKLAGFMAIGPLDKKPYRVVNDRDIFMAIEEAAHV